MLPVPSSRRDTTQSGFPAHPHMEDSELDKQHMCDFSGTRYLGANANEDAAPFCGADSPVQRTMKGLDELCRVHVPQAENKTKMQHHAAVLTPRCGGPRRFRRGFSGTRYLDEKRSEDAVPWHAFSGTRYLDEKRRDDATPRHGTDFSSTRENETKTQHHAAVLTPRCSGAGEVWTSSPGYAVPRREANTQHHGAVLTPRRSGPWEIYFDGRSFPDWQVGLGARTMRDARIVRFGQAKPYTVVQIDRQDKRAENKRTVRFSGTACCFSWYTAPQREIEERESGAVRWERMGVQDNVRCGTHCHSDADTLTSQAKDRKLSAWYRKQRTRRRALHPRCARVPTGAKERVWITDEGVKPAVWEKKLHFCPFCDSLRKGSTEEVGNRKRKGKRDRPHTVWSISALSASMILFSDQRATTGAQNGGRDRSVKQRVRRRASRVLHYGPDARALTGLVGRTAVVDLRTAG
ncbi:hypothetical protein K438DRAFT_1940081 [Mycena galopus ATCC 62051]|nr:hypothetical protein K438DRAFT_1940081 [Mycena galopus ATCC 62051]